MSAPKNPLSVEESLAYFEANGLETTERKAGRRIWEPILVKMIEKHAHLNEIIAWIAKHHQKLGYSKPADATLRDWLCQIRRERGMPLRRRKSNSAPLEPKIQTSDSVSVKESATLPAAPKQTKKAHSSPTPPIPRTGNRKSEAAPSTPTPPVPEITKKKPKPADLLPPKDTVNFSERVLPPEKKMNVL